MQFQKQWHGNSYQAIMDFIEHKPCKSITSLPGLFWKMAVKRACAVYVYDVAVLLQVQ